ncbi:MAG: porin [Polyangiaceae bacterium]
MTPRRLTLLLVVWSASAVAQPNAADEVGPRETPQVLAEQQRRIEQLEVAVRNHEQEEEAAALESATAGADAEVAEAVHGDPIKIYGYIDVGWQKMMAKQTSLVRQVSTTNANTFVLGNVNLFFDAQPSESWRGLTELHLTNAPHGNELSYASDFGTEYERVDSTANDPTAATGRNQILLGSVVIERAWIQYSHNSELNLRAGYFLTPFGVWNLDHGTPTLISMVLPEFQTRQYFPSRQTGVQALGSAFAGPWELGYHATVSNGRSVGTMDIDDNKALGGRLHATHMLDGRRVALGASAFYGTFVDYQKRLTAVDPLRVETDVTVSGTEWTLGADVSLDFDGWRLRAEGAMQRVSYDPDKRAPMSGPPGAQVPDQNRWNGYALFAYRLPGTALEPYGYLEGIHRPNSLGDTVIGTSVGMNVYFTPAAQLKLQYSQIRFTNQVTETDKDPSDHDFAVFVSRLVLAF